MMNKNKRGELTSRQLIIIIILIISFVIILAFFFILDIGGTIDKESCRNSVVMKGTFSKIPVIGKGFISLKCKTQDVCLSMGGECEVETDSTIKVKDKDDLIKEMVNLLADCWWMMGEGKISYGDIGDCAMCYRVHFDNEIATFFYKDLHSYMKTNQVSNTEESYLYYLYGVNDLDGVEKRWPDSIKTKFDGGYAVVTGIVDVNPGYFHWARKGFFSPVVIKFDSEELDKLKCSKYVTEV